MLRELLDSTLATQQYYSVICQDRTFIPLLDAQLQLPSKAAGSACPPKFSDTHLRCTYSHVKTSRRVCSHSVRITDTYLPDTILEMERR